MVDSEKVRYPSMILHRQTDTTNSNTVVASEVRLGGLASRGWARLTDNYNC